MRGQADIIWQLMESMPALGVEPNLINFNTAIRAIARTGDFSRVNQERDEPRKQAPPPRRHALCPSPRGSAFYTRAPPHLHTTCTHSMQRPPCGRSFSRA